MTLTSVCAEAARCRPASRAAWLGVVCLLGSLCAGCGGGDDTPQTVPPPESEQTTEPASEAPAGEPAGPAGTEPGAEPAEPEDTAEDKPADGFQMPPGEVPPSPSDDDAPSESGGIQMPETDEDAGSNPSASQSSRKVRPSGEVQSSGDGELDLQYASWQSVHQAATSGGKITVVDVWALSCQPCLKEFPGLVELNKRFSDSARCIGFNVDFDGRKTRPPETYEDRITEFLRAVEADFPNYISQTPSLEVFDALEIDSIPAVLVFDEQGELVEQFADTGETAGFTYEEDIIPLVAKLAG